MTIIFQNLCNPRNEMLTNTSVIQGDKIFKGNNNYISNMLIYIYIFILNSTKIYKKCTQNTAGTSSINIHYITIFSLK